MPTFFDSEHCKSRQHCHACRNVMEWRAAIMDGFDDVKGLNFTCPEGLRLNEPINRKKKNKGSSKSEQAASFMQAIQKAFEKAKEKGEKLCDPPRRNARIELCKKCEEWSDCRCGVCGCSIALKIVVATESCPKGKWK